MCVCYWLVLIILLLILKPLVVLLLLLIAMTMCVCSIIDDIGNVLLLMCVLRYDSDIN